LPPLPPGRYRFVVDPLGLACPVLVAVEPEQGSLAVLLPESNSWVAMRRAAGAGWGQALRNPRGWRMELVHAPREAIAYCPSGNGLAAITPDAIGLRYAVGHAGEGPAIGGPVAWEGGIWAPVLGRDHVIQLVGKVHGTAGHVVVPTQAPVPRGGFEAPVCDPLHVNWPCEEGQLVLRLGAGGGRQCEWIPWPAQVEPLFAVGGPYFEPTGTFWQLCRRIADGRFDYVQMASAAPEIVTLDAPVLSTGGACYRGTLLADGEPWRAAQAGDGQSQDIVAPLLESTHDGAVVGLRMEAPHGLPALLEGGDQRCRAVLQVQVRGRPAVSFGRLDVRRPWNALPFVHDGHLWVDHPELPRALGWKLAL